MNIKELEKIVELLCENGATEFELEQDGTRLLVKRGGGQAVLTSVPVVQAPVQASTSPADEAAALESEDGLEKVKSPIVGTFYRKPSPEADAFVQEGDKVSKGDTLCIIEAMKLMNEIESPCDGTIQKVLLSDGQVVEFGEPLFLIEPSR